jgi:hypothetical protein
LIFKPFGYSDGIMIINNTPNNQYKIKCEKCSSICGIEKLAFAQKYLGLRYSLHDKYYYTCTDCVHEELPKNFKAVLNFNPYERYSVSSKEEKCESCSGQYKNIINYHNYCTRMDAHFLQGCNPMNYTEIILLKLCINCYLVAEELWKKDIIHYTYDSKNGILKTICEEKNATCKKRWKFFAIYLILFARLDPNSHFYDFPLDMVKIIFEFL